eukprot:gene28934-32127_t
MAVSGASSIDDNKAKLEALYAPWRDKFASVGSINAADLKALIEQTDRGEAKVLVVDIRTPEEQEVGKCVLIQSDFEAKKDELSGNGYTVVTYCTAGYRSGIYAIKLKEEGGFETIMNFEGSILAWTQEGFELVELRNRDTQTRRVHVFGPSWSLQGEGFEPVVFQNPWFRYG